MYTFRIAGDNPNEYLCERNRVSYIFSGYTLCESIGILGIGITSVFYMETVEPSAPVPPRPTRATLLCSFVELDYPGQCSNRRLAAPAFALDCTSAGLI